MLCCVRANLLLIIKFSQTNTQTRQDTNSNKSCHKTKATRIKMPFYHCTLQLLGCFFSISESPEEEHKNFYHFYKVWDIMDIRQKVFSACTGIKKYIYSVKGMRFVHPKTIHAIQTFFSTSRVYVAFSMPLCMHFEYSLRYSDNFPSISNEYSILSVSYCSPLFSHIFVVFKCKIYYIEQFCCVISMFSLWQSNTHTHKMI